MKKTERDRFSFFKSYYDSYKNLQNNKEKAEFIEIILAVSFLEKNIEEIDPKNFNVKLLFSSIKHSLKSSVDGFISKTASEPPYEPPTEGGIEPPYEPPTEQYKYKIKDKIENKTENKPLVRDINLQQCTSISSISNYINKKKDFVDPIKAGMIMGNVREAFKQGDDIRDIQLMVESALQNVFEQRGSLQVAKKTDPEKKEEPKQIYRQLDSNQENMQTSDFVKLDKNWLTKLVEKERQNAKH